ncbi:hypothetical protein JCM6882_007139 [Rhodosporidiobolus microsporus]
MPSEPSTDGTDPRPSKSPFQRNASLAPSSSSTSRRARSRSTFSLEIPVYTSTQRTSTKSKNTSSSMANSRAGSAAPPPAAEPASSSSANAGGSKEGSAAPADAVKRILKVQKNAGMEASFLCELEGGRKVQRSRSALSAAAPDLLTEFETSQPSSKASSPLSSGSGSSDVVVQTRGRAVKSQRGPPPKRRAQDEDEDMEGESSEEEDDEKDEDVEEPSSDDDEDDDDGDDFDEDDLHPRRSSRKKQSRAVREGSRHSSRNAGREKKRYDFGDGALAVDEDEDDQKDSSSGSEHRHATRSNTRSTRSTRSLSSRRQGGDDSGESSDELSMMSASRKTAPAPPKRSNARARVADSDEDFDELAEDTPSSSPGRRSSNASEHSRPQDLHRQTCAKCSHEPASELFRKFRLRKGKKKPGRQRKRDILEEDTDAEEDRLSKLGAWVECGVCCSAYHFGCLPMPQKREITDSLKAEHEAAHSTSATPGAEDAGAEGQSPEEQRAAAAAKARALPKREKEELDPELTFELKKCPSCKKQGGRRCFVCAVSGKKVAQRELDEYGSEPSTSKTQEEDAAMAPAEGAEPVDAEEKKKEEESENKVEPGLMFRCGKCKRIAHYGCLENDEPQWSFEQHVQSYFDWQICHDCYNFNVPLDAILAWAEADPLPVGKDDVESDDEVVEKVVGERRVDAKTQKVYDIPSAKDLRANAKYLVKWQDMSYRHLEWVPHAWLSASHYAKLSNFLTRGSTVSFEPPKDDDDDDEDPDKEERDDEAPLPDANAMDRIPKTWRTVDRVLEVWYHHPKKAGETVVHDDYVRRYDLPDDEDEALELVSQCKIKWGELPYAQCTDEAPPTANEDGYAEYVAAYKAFLAASDPKMSVPSLTKKQMAELDEPRDPKRFVAIKEQPSYITGGKLMDFQIEGVNFLRYQWWQRKGCILADEMGLGKTCQIISFLSYLNQDEGARPFLVVVPNSLVGNWLREFARWAPAMRVVPFSGDAESRKIVEQYELFDGHGSLKTHVVLATYEALQGNARVFRRVGRWDTIVIDEGQRLKSGKSSQLYTAIESLNVCNRILLSGTPLNNNLREVFNLLAFINPKEIPDVEALTERFAELTPALVEEVRQMLKPYFLRRTKNLVLNLPPLNEMVVPVTMTVLQRRIYRGILERNAPAIHAMIQKSSSSTRKPKKSNFANILMELRKSLCHPYLVDADIEPRNATPEQAHINLSEASAKLVLLQCMLPKLKAAGHRVLIFSQFKITLNVVERFLAGLKLKYLRLDGDTPQIDRQRDVDKYNAPGSEYFVYLLSTRAGGVGLNITSADVVIIYDQDFNPQMDLQAISRAHRIGQTKPVRVFKLLVKHTCEEKIFAAGRKKLGLEHLIIQRIDAQDESEDIESMLQHGAQAVFDEEAAEKDAIRYGDSDIDALLKKTADTTEGETEAAGTFAEAQVWSVSKGGLDAVDAVDAVNEGPQGQDLHDFWSKVVEEQQEAERQAKAAQAANVGRGKRRRNEVNYAVPRISPQKKDKKKTSASPSIDSELSSGDEYRQKRDEIDSDDDWAEPMDVDDLPTNAANPLQAPPPLARLEPSGSGSNTPVPGSTKGKNKLDPSDPAYAAAVAAKRDESKKKTKLTLGGLLTSAIQAGNKQVQAMLDQAYKSDSRTEQTTLMLQAARILRAEAKALKTGGPLVPLPGVANQASSAASSQHAPYASTSGSVAASTSGMAPPAAPRPVPSSSDAAAVAAAAAALAEKKRQKLERKRRKEEERLRRENAERLAAEQETRRKELEAEREKRMERDWILSEKQRRKAEKEKKQAEWIPPTSISDPRLAPVIAAGGASKASTAKAPSPPSGPPSDGSSGGRTPKLKQQTLSFAKKPSPPTANASGSGSSQPVASSSQAVPAKRPSPPSSSSQAVPAKRPSPPSSSSKAIPAKRPSPSSSAASAPKKPTPPTKGSSARKQKEPMVIDLISDSEEE